MAGVLRTGWGTKRGAVNKSWKRRYFVLRDDNIISYYADSSDIRGKPKGVIKVSGPGISFILGEEAKKDVGWPSNVHIGTRLQIGTPDRTFYIAWETPEAADGWLKILRQAAGIAPAVSASPASSITLGMPISDKAVPAGNEEDDEERQRELHSQLRTLTQSGGNRNCFDCKSLNPTWAVHNIGVFVCLRCAGIHRSLGTHISKVKSINLDAWTKEQVDGMTSRGNEVVREDLEAVLPAEYPRPADSREEMEKFIKAKYVKKQYSKGGPTDDGKRMSVSSGSSSGDSVSSFVS